MRELGVEVPSPDSVRLSRWARLQARIAPVDRLLAAREAAEDEEVDDLYKRSTGDATTDQLLHDIRKEERSHSMAVGEMRSGESDATPPAPPTLSASQQRAKARLDKIMGREKWHQTSGGWISGAIYGANDGLASVFGIVAGVSGRDRRLELRADRRRRRRDRVGALDGDRRLPGRARRGGGRGGQPRPRARRDRAASRGGEGGAVALLPAEGSRRGDRRRDGRADRAPARRVPAGARDGGVRRRRAATVPTPSRRRSPPGSPPASGR